MNIHLDLWLIYLINILPDVRIFLVATICILLLWSVFLICLYMDIAEDINTLKKEKLETVIYEGKTGLCEDFCDKLKNSCKRILKIARWSSGAIVAMLLLYTIIPTKENAIQLVKINYINQSNILLDANSIDTLSQNIDSILILKGEKK
jgi:hypothetical protein